jgi:hypothetical protein
LTKNTIFPNQWFCFELFSSSKFNKRLNIHHFYSVNEPL